MANGYDNMCVWPAKAIQISQYSVELHGNNSCHYISGML